MGSCSSSPKNNPSEIRSAPPTARSTPAAPKRNRQSQDVQLGQSGGTPPTRQRARGNHARSQGASPSQQQATITQSRAQKCQDPGAAGMTNGKQTSSTMTKKEDDLVLETFYHRSGNQFPCIYQGGMRFYLKDQDSKEWQPFPKRWYSEGLLVTDTIV